MEAILFIILWIFFCDDLSLEHFCHSRRRRLDLESGVRSLTCLRRNSTGSFTKQRRGIEPIEDEHYHTCYFTFACQTGDFFFGFPFNFRDLGWNCWTALDSFTPAIHQSSVRSRLVPPPVQGQSVEILGGVLRGGSSRLQRLQRLCLPGFRSGRKGHRVGKSIQVNE